MSRKQALQEEETVGPNTRNAGEGPVLGYGVYRGGLEMRLQRYRLGAKLPKGSAAVFLRITSKH